MPCYSYHKRLYCPFIVAARYAQYQLLHYSLFHLPSTTKGHCRIVHVVIDMDQHVPESRNGLERLNDFFGDNPGLCETDKHSAYVSGSFRSSLLTKCLQTATICSTARSMLRPTNRFVTMFALNASNEPTGTDLSSRSRSSIFRSFFSTITLSIIDNHARDELIFIVVRHSLFPEAAIRFPVFDDDRKTVFHDLVPEQRGGLVQRRQMDVPACCLGQGDNCRELLHSLRRPSVKDRYV